MPLRASEGLRNEAAPSLCTSSDMAPNAKCRDRTQHLRVLPECKGSGFVSKAPQGNQGQDA